MALIYCLNIKLMLSNIEYYYHDDIVGMPATAMLSKQDTENGVTGCLDLDVT